MSTASVVIVARHGERLDYSVRDQGGNWQSSADRPFDTPLTNHGLEQGKALGRQITKEIENHGLPGLVDIYSSPFLRCRQTAMAARRGLLSFHDPIKVEIGLAESINEQWFRSWALPGSNGTWGYRPNDNAFDPATFHPKSKEPVQPLLDWKVTISEAMRNDELCTAFDLQYESITSVEKPYMLHPPLFETNDDQRQRMRQVVDRMAAPGKSILLVSHGGPVTHLFEELTGEPWTNHGESSYCCYSIYVKTEKLEWKALVVNEAQYLHETIVTEKHV